ncbi:MAG: HAD family hydrolase [Clostridia bacterium]|nr:HAD family hydrolase [Clostridia bacterium]
MLPKAIFFDMDDTILSFKSVCDPAWEEVCATFEKRRGIIEAKVLLNAINEIRDWYWRDSSRHKTGRLDMNQARRNIVCMAFDKLGHKNEEAAFEVADHYSQLQEELMHPFPGAIETLEHLVAKDVKLCLITNGGTDKQRAKINRFDLEKYFQHCLVEGELGFGKPDVRVYELALKRMEVLPKDAWMVGDNLEWDVEAPQKLGIYSVWNDFEQKGLPTNSKVVPDRIIGNISELI